MDRLSAILSLFSPTALPLNVFSSRRGGVSFGDHSVMAIIQQGQGRLKLNDAITLNVEKGDLLWLPKGQTPVKQLTQTEIDIVSWPLDFGSNQLNPLLDTLPIVLHIQNQDPARLSLEPIIQLLLQESIDGRCGQEAVVNRLSEVLLVHVLRFLIEHRKLESGVLAGLADKRLARPITAMHRQPELSWTVQSLAQVAGMSRTAFNQHFKQIVGITPGEYLNQWRMRLACRFLEDQQTPIGAIGDQLGYQSETAFYRAFRRQFNLSPGQYRQQRKALAQQNPSTLTAPTDELRVPAQNID